jgi:hypothetical protein
MPDSNRLIPLGLQRVSVPTFPPAVDRRFDGSRLAGRRPASPAMHDVVGVDVGNASRWSYRQ